MNVFRYPRTGSTSTQTPQSAGGKWKEMKFHWYDGFLLGDIVSCQWNGRELLGLIKNFVFNEQVNNLSDRKKYLDALCVI